MTILNRNSTVRLLMAMLVFGGVTLFLLTQDDEMLPGTNRALAVHPAQVPDSENAYIYLLGFAAGPFADPRKVGLQRLTAYREALAAADTPGAGLLSFTDPQPRAGISAPDLSYLCNLSEDGCLQQLLQKTPGILRLAQRFSILEHRLQRLYLHTHLQSSTRPTASEPLPDYRLLLQAAQIRRLHLLASAAQHAPGAARDALVEAIQKNRRLLSLADSLYLKSSFTHILIGDLRALGSLRDLTPDLPLPALPALSEEERSLQAALQREFHGIVNDISALDHQPLLREALPGPLRLRFEWLYQANMTNNTLHHWLLAAQKNPTAVTAELPVLLNGGCRLCVRNHGGQHLLAAMLPDPGRTYAVLAELNALLQAYAKSRAL